MIAPGKDGDNFCLDMATTTVALGKVEVASRKGEKIPDGWGTIQDIKNDRKNKNLYKYSTKYKQINSFFIRLKTESGENTNDPDECFKTGGLFPLGGREETGGYKGYGLGMMVDIFCGIMAGSKYANNVRRWGFATDGSNPADLGQENLRNVST